MRDRRFAVGVAVGLVLVSAPLLAASGVSHSPRGERSVPGRAVGPVVPPAPRIAKAAVTAVPPARWPSARAAVVDTGPVAGSWRSAGDLPLKVASGAGRVRVELLDR